MSTIATFQSGLPFHVPLYLASSLNLWGWWHLWSVTSWGNPARVTVSTSIVQLEVETVQAAPSLWKVVAPCLTVKPHPDWSLVAEPSVYTMRSCGLLVSWLWSLISGSVLPAGHCRQCFPKFSGRSFSQRRRDQIGYLSHCLVCLSSISWHTCSIKSSDPPKTCPVPVCIPLCFSRLRGVDCGYFRWNWSMLWLASFCVWFTLVLAWTSWSQRVCPWWFRHDRTGWLGVKRKEKRKKVIYLGSSQYDPHCPFLHSVQLQQICLCHCYEAQCIVNDSEPLSATLWYSRKRWRCSIPFAAIAFRPDRSLLHFSAVG